MARGPFWLMILVLGTLAAFAPACRRPASIADASILRISQRNEPATLDPAKATLPDEFFVLRALLEGLAVPDPAGGEPQPAAAERWSVSADGLTYTFHLRADGQWSDGTPVVAADFVASYRRALTPATAAAKADLFFQVEGAEEFYRGALTDFGQTGFSKKMHYYAPYKGQTSAADFRKFYQHEKTFFEKDAAKENLYR